MAIAQVRRDDIASGQIRAMRWSVHVLSRNRLAGARDSAQQATYVGIHVTACVTSERCALGEGHDIDAGRVCLQMDARELHRRQHPTAHRQSQLRVWTSRGVRHRHGVANHAATKAEDTATWCSAMPATEASIYSQDQDSLLQHSKMMKSCITKAISPVLGQHCSPAIMTLA